MANNQNVIAVSNSSTSLPLLEGEQIIFKVRPNFLITFFFLLLILSAGAGLFWILLSTRGFERISAISSFAQMAIFAAVFVFIMLVVFLYWFSTEYILTDQRVEWRFGIIGKGVISIALDRIQNISLSIGITGAIFNFGNIKIEPAGLTTSINFNGISDPKNKKELIESKSR